MISNIETEASLELQNLEQLEGKSFYSELVESNLLCGLKQWVRVLREVRDLNEDFHTLRTCIGAVSDTVGVLHFIMYPADGAFADKPLCGRILIPATYPEAPPVVHLLTLTNRFNVDIYHEYSEKHNLRRMHSSMCFDVLKPKGSGGVWESTFTISCLMASLMQSIVSMKVPQQYGGEQDEVVSMEKLASSNKEVDKTLSLYKQYMPSMREIPRIEASPVDTKYFDFPKSIWSPINDRFMSVHSQSIRLQGKDEPVYSIGFDLSDLHRNPNTVFSIVLSNDTQDLQGRNKNTIIVRNGVTATAAKKKVGEELKWFYHGKPMNQSKLKLIVSVGHSQFCISYVEDDKVLVHGDCPVSFLTKSEIGNVGTMRFYLSVLMKNKGGNSIKVITYQPEKGYLHPIYASK